MCKERDAIAHQRGDLGLGGGDNRSANCCPNPPSSFKEWFSAIFDFNVISVEEHNKNQSYTQLFYDSVEVIEKTLENQLTYMADLMTAPFGGLGKGQFAKQILQHGGHTLKPGTLKALNLTKEQVRNAIHALKESNNLRNNFHGIIMRNGDYLNPSTKMVIDNLLKYIF